MGQLIQQGWLWEAGLSTVYNRLNLGQPPSGFDLHAGAEYRHIYIGLAFRSQQYEDFWSSETFPQDGGGATGVEYHFEFGVPKHMAVQVGWSSVWSNRWLVRPVAQFGYQWAWRPGMLFSLGAQAGARLFGPVWLSLSAEVGGLPNGLNILETLMVRF